MKRSLDIPLQVLNRIMGEEELFQDETCYPHKKFRRNNSSSSKIDDLSSMSHNCSHGDQSATPSSLTSHQSSSKLASETEKPQMNCQNSMKTPKDNHSLSILETILRRKAPYCTPEEKKRKELLANIILEERVCPMDTGHHCIVKCATTQQDNFLNHSKKDTVSISTKTSRLYRALTNSNRQKKIIHEPIEHLTRQMPELVTIDPQSPPPMPRLVCIDSQSNDHGLAINNDG